MGRLRIEKGRPKIERTPKNRKGRLESALEPFLDHEIVKKIRIFHFFSNF